FASILEDEIVGARLAGVHGGTDLPDHRQTLRRPNQLINVLADRFGTRIAEGTFRTRVPDLHGLIRAPDDARQRRAIDVELQPSIEIFESLAALVELLADAAALVDVLHHADEVHRAFAGRAYDRRRQTTPDDGTVLADVALVGLLGAPFAARHLAEHL